MLPLDGTLDVCVPRAVDVAAGVTDWITIDPGVVVAVLVNPWTAIDPGYVPVVVGVIGCVAFDAVVLDV